MHARLTSNISFHAPVSYFKVTALEIVYRTQLGQTDRATYKLSRSQRLAKLAGIEPLKLRPVRFLHILRKSMSTAKTHHQRCDSQKLQKASTTLLRINKQEI